MPTTNVLVDDLQLGSTRLLAGGVLAPDEVARVIAAGGLVVSDDDSAPNFAAVFNALPEVVRMRMKGDGPGARVRMMRAYAEALAAQNVAVQQGFAAISDVVTDLVNTGRLPTRVTLTIAANDLLTLPAGQKVFTVSTTLPAKTVLLGWSLGPLVGGFNDSSGTGGSTTYSLAATSFFTGENVKRGVGVYPRRASTPDVLAFSGNDVTYASAPISLTLTSSADLNTVDTVGGVVLGISYFATP